MPHKNSKKKHPGLFNSETKLSPEQTALENELSHLIDITTEYRNTHNAVVKRYFHTQRQIQEYDAQLTDPQTPLNEDQRKVLSDELQKLNTIAKQLHDSLIENHSDEILKKNFKKIEQLHNELYPQNKIDFSIAPIDLENLRRKNR